MKILITGGTGSLGHALVKEFHREYKVIVLSRDEVKQAQMAQRYPEVDYYLGDVRDYDRLVSAFQDVKVVIHAAALKRVDSVANDPDEVFKTNVLGTQNVLRAARTTRVQKVLLISSDKACYPTNAYGVSKAMAEHLTIGANVYGYPRWCASSVLRYGNVMGSRGSVLNVWRDRLKAGQALTLTDPAMTRFVITMSQAVALVRAAIEQMEGGEIFVPRLPASLVTTWGTALAGAPMWQITGLRPGGEKLHETLMTEEESRRARMFGDVFLVPPSSMTWRSDNPWEDLPGESVGTYVSNLAPVIPLEELHNIINDLPVEGV